MDKSEEKDIKNLLKEEYSFKEYHIDKFNIDMDKFLANKTIDFEEKFYIFGDHGDVKDVTKKLIF